MESLQKAILEGFRVMVLAAIPLLIDGLQKGELDINLLSISVSIALLRFVDKWLHLYGKEEGDDMFITGLTRF